MSRHGHATRSNSNSSIDSDPTTQADRLQAKIEVLSLLKSRPGILIQIGAPQDANDKELITALARTDSPRGLLRAAGYDASSANKAAELLPDALWAVHREKSQRKWRKHWWKCALCAGVFFVISLSLLLGFLWVNTWSKAGWLPGKCTIAEFYNSSCTMSSGCSFVVTVYKVGGAPLMMHQWSPELDRDASSNRITFVGDAFRCCDSAEWDCCGFVDPETMYFCDKWPHRTAPDGSQCPDGKWACLYQTDPGDSNLVTELKPTVEQPWSYHLLAWCIATCLVCLCLATSCFWEPHCCKPRRRKGDEDDDEAPTWQRKTISKFTHSRLHKKEAAMQALQATAAAEEESFRSKSPKGAAHLQRSHTAAEFNSTLKQQSPGGSAKAAESTPKTPVLSRAGAADLELGDEDANDDPHPTGSATPQTPGTPAASQATPTTRATPVTPGGSKTPGTPGTPTMPATPTAAADLSVILDPLSEGAHLAFGGDALKRLAAEHSNKAKDLFRPIIAPLDCNSPTMLRPPARAGHAVAGRSKSAQQRRLRLSAQSPHSGSSVPSELWSCSQVSRGSSRVTSATSRADDPRTWGFADQASLLDAHHVVDVGLASHNSPLRVTASSHSITRGVQGTPCNTQTAVRALAMRQDDMEEAGEISPLEYEPSPLGPRPRASHKRRRPEPSNRHAAIAAAAVRQTVSRGGNRFH